MIIITLQYIIRFFTSSRKDSSSSFRAWISLVSWSIRRSLEVADKTSIMKSGNQLHFQGNRCIEIPVDSGPDFCIICPCLHNEIKDLLCISVVFQSLLVILAHAVLTEVERVDCSRGAKQVVKLRLQRSLLEKVKERNLIKINQKMASFYYFICCQLL